MKWQTLISKAPPRKVMLDNENMQRINNQTKGAM